MRRKSRGHSYVPKKIPLGYSPKTTTPCRKQDGCRDSRVERNEPHPWKIWGQRRDKCGVAAAVTILQIEMTQRPSQQSIDKASPTGRCSLSAAEKAQM